MPKALLVCFNDRKPCKRIAASLEKVGFRVETLNIVKALHGVTEMPNPDALAKRHQALVVSGRSSCELDGLSCGDARQVCSKRGTCGKSFSPKCRLVKGVGAIIRGFERARRAMLFICYGMQLWAHLNGGKVTRMREANGLKLYRHCMHRVELDTTSPLLEGLPEQAEMCHIHSRCVRLGNVPRRLKTVGWADYGAAVLSRSNRCFGVQFHPEYSKALGAQLFANFASIAGKRSRVKRPAVKR